MSAAFLQFPLKQTVVTQCVREGVMWFAYVVRYEFAGQHDTFYLWARDDEDAVARIYSIAINAEIVGKLKDQVVDQTGPRV